LGLCRESPFCLHGTGMDSGKRVNFAS